MDQLEKGGIPGKEAHQECLKRLILRHIET